MKRFALFAAIWFAAGAGLSAITIGDTEVDLGADIRSRYLDMDGYFCGYDGCHDEDFGALEMRFRIWASADITDTISTALRLNLAQGELGTEEEDDGAFHFSDESLGVEFAYITWHNEWGDVYLGRIPAAMVGNDLILDSQRYDGWTGAYEGVFVSFADFEGWDLDLFYIDDNAADSCSGPSEDCGHGIGVVVGFGEMIGWDLHIGAAEYNDDMTGTGDEYSALFAGATIDLSDVAVVEVSWIDGDGGNTMVGMGGASSSDQGNAFIVRLDYEVNEDVGVHAMYANVEPGAVYDGGCHHNDSGATCGGFGFQPLDLETFGSDGGYIFPGDHDGDMWHLAVTWGDHWTLGYTTWDSSSYMDTDLLSLTHEVVL